MSDDTLMHPAPLLCANIYCADLLDCLISDAILPFWTNLKAIDPDHHCYLWLARYMRGGEHLKVRIHCPSELKPLVEGLLRASVEVFFEAYRDQRAADDRDPCADQFPVDLEDECFASYPDQTLLLTHYRYLPALLGRLPLSDDPCLAALFTLNLGLGTEIILRELALDRGLFQNRKRMALATRFFVGAVLVLDQSREQSLAYLLYHRNWMLKVTRVDRHRAAHQFEEKAVRAHGLVARLSLILSGGGEPNGLDCSSQRWSDSFADLFDHIVRRGGAGFMGDEIRKDQVFATPFKLLHALTNQLGLSALDEAYLCHLLLHALTYPKQNDSGHKP